MSRLPIRLRLTLPFAVAMALVLVAVAAFVYVRVGSALLRAVDESLRGQAAEAAQRVGRGRPLLDRDAADGATFAQLLASGGRVTQSTRPSLAPLASVADVRRVLAGATVRRTSALSGLDGEWRILAASAGADRVVVVAQSLAPRDEALDRLLREFTVGGPAALLLAIGAGYVLASSALRPVEAMRQRAAAITAATPGRLLPLPPGRDELARLAETLNDMLRRLHAALEHERRFVDDASHELRTPLALLRAELELALRQPRSREELERALGAAADDAERLTRLAEDLLLVARFDQGRLPVRLERGSARALLFDVAERFEARALARRRSLTVVAGGDALVEADPARLEQALGNLVENALVHGAGAIELSVRTVGGTLELHVTDDGAGFPAEFLPRAFDRFSRADDARGRGGTGLGLAIVDAIARAHGGHAAVANRRAGGADAWIALPAVRAARTPRTRAVGVG